MNDIEPKVEPAAAEHSVCAEPAERYNARYAYALQDQSDCRIGGNEPEQQPGFALQFAVKQEVMGTSPSTTTSNYALGFQPVPDTTAPQHKMTILELRENQEIMQQQQITGQWQQQQQTSMFQMQQQSMLYPSPPNRLLSASPSGGGCISIDADNTADAYATQQQQQQSHLTTVSENGDATIDELFNADNGSGVDIFGADTLEKQFDFGIGAAGVNGGNGDNAAQMDFADPM